MPFFNGESSSDTLIDRGLEYFFHVGPCDSTLIASTYDYLDLYRESLGIESVAICGSDDDGGSMFVEFCEKEAKERNYTIGTSIIYPTDAATLSAECMKLKSCGAECAADFRAESGVDHLPADHAGNGHQLQICHHRARRLHLHGVL